MRLNFIFLLIVVYPVSGRRNLQPIERDPRAATSSLSQVTDHLSSVARLVNAIALQNGLSTNSSSFPDFVAELLDVESGNVIQRLEQLPIDANLMNTQLDAVVRNVKGLGTNPLLNDSAQVRDGIASLENWKGKVGDLEAGAVDGVEKEFAEEMERMHDSSIVPKDLFFNQNIEQSAESLVALFAPYKKSGSDISRIGGACENFTKFGPLLSSDLKNHSNYLTTLASLFNIISKYKVLDPVMTIVEIAKQYKSIETDLLALPPKVQFLKKESDLVLPIVRKHATFSQANHLLSPIVSVLKTLITSRTTVRHLTAGIPNGAKDITQLMIDLKGDWMKKELADGKDIGEIAEGLFLIEKVAAKLAQVETSWQLFRNSSNATISAEIMASVSNELAKEGKELSKINNLNGSIDAISQSLSNLNPLTGFTDFTDFEDVYKFSKNFSDLAEGLKAAYGEVIPKIPNNIDSVINALVVLATPMKADSEYDEINSVYLNIQSTTGSKDLMNFLTMFVSKLKPFWELGELVNVTMDWTVIKPVQSAFGGTGLVGALKALQGNQFDQNAVDKILKFGMNARKIQNSQKDVKSVISMLQAVEKVKNGVDEVKKEVMSWKGRRRRDVSDANELKKLEKSEELALSIGQGVNVLRRMAHAHEKTAELTAAADSGDEVNKVIGGVPSMKQVWTDENRNALKKMVSQLGELEKFSAENKDKDLMVMASVFKKASEINGVPIAANSIRDDVLPALAASTDPKVKAALPTFTAISDLELDFAKHSSQLNEALLSLDAVKSFFDRMFKTTGADQSEATGEDNAFLKKIIIIVIIVLVITITIVIFLVFWCKWRQSAKYKKQLDDPERWILLCFHHETTFKDTCKPFKHVKNNDLEALKPIIKKGFYIDARFQCNKESEGANTLLHDAVLYDRPIIAKFLIENGADLWLKNHKYETPMMIAEKMKKKQMMALLKKYERKKVYQKVIPEPLPESQYKVYLDPKMSEKVAGRSQFLKKFSKNSVTEMSKASHFVVEVDKERYLKVETWHIPLIFHPSMLMSHHWLNECVKNPDAFGNNQEWRVKGMKYQGEKYDTIIRIKDLINRRKVPFLYGAIVVYNETAFPSYLYKTINGYLHGSTSEHVAKTPPEGHIYYREDIPKQILLWSTDKGKQSWAPYESDTKHYFIMHETIFIAFLLEFQFHCKKIEFTETWVDPREMTSIEAAESVKSKAVKKKKKKKSKDSSTSKSVSSATSKSKVSTMSTTTGK